MMPRLLPFVLRRSAAAAILLAVIALGLALPARHVLVAPWPEFVDEVLTEAGPGQVQRLFVPGNSSGAARSTVVARSRPITLWRLETASEEVVHAWLAGVRDEAGELLPAPPAWLEAVRLDAPLPGPVELVMTTAERETRAIRGADIQRMYRPNDLSLPERTALWRDRLIQRWRFNPGGVARTTPPAR
jgi:hypothetical protein